MVLCKNQSILIKSDAAPRGRIELEGGGVGAKWWKARKGRDKEEKEGERERRVGGMKCE